MCSLILNFQVNRILVNTCGQFIVSIDFELFKGADMMHKLVGFVRDVKGYVLALFIYLF